MNLNTTNSENDFSQKKIIFFDGVCNLCNGFIDFVIKRDKQKKIFYCSLQSDIAKDILKKYNITIGQNFSTIFFYENGKVFNKSKAILNIIKNLSICYKILAFILSLIPNFIRNFVYFYISKYRYKLFGEKETCRMPSPDERNQFL